MTTTRIGIEVGKSFSRTYGGETLVVTAIASPWAEARIAELEAALKLIASGMQGDRFLADWELSDIANKALTPKRDQ